MTKPSHVALTREVRIPDDVLDALGVRPGDAIEFVLRGNGEAVIRKSSKPDPEYERRYREGLRRIADARKFALPPSGMTTDEYMAMIREPVPDADRK
jgi:antitoxin component of MazEF toxin-antitoxin module